MDDERQKKIEAGKLMFAEFKKKRTKVKPYVPANNSPSNLQEYSSLKETSEKEISLKSATTENILIMEENKLVVAQEADGQSTTESSCPESSDETEHLEATDIKDLLLQYEKKLKVYQAANNHKDNVIKQLSDRLSSAMIANEHADSAKEEITLLNQQMKEIAEQMQKKESKIGALQIQNEVLKGTREVCESGVQVEPSMCYSILTENPEILEGALMNFYHFPTLTEKLAVSFKTNASRTELENFVQRLIPSVEKKSTSVGTEHPSEIQQASENDVPLLLKRIDVLSAVTRLVESVVATTLVKTLGSSSGDFSCSKFQSYFLKRLNSSDAETLEPDLSENESVVSDINYAEVEDKSVLKNLSDFPSIEKMRSRPVAEDLNLATDFLVDEMEKISVSSLCARIGAREEGGMTSAVLPECLRENQNENMLNSVEKDDVNRDYQKFVLQKSKLESRLKQLKCLDKEILTADCSLHHRSIDSDALAASEDNILLEEPPLSCISLLSLTDSEYRTENVMTDSETNFSRKVSFDMARPGQDRPDRDMCVKCEKYFNTIRERYDDHVCIFKDSLQNNFKLDKTEAVRKLEVEIEKLKAEKDDLGADTENQIELLCHEQEMKVQYLTNEYEKQLSQLKNSVNEWKIERDNLLTRVSTLEEELRHSKDRVQEILQEKTSLFQKQQDEIDAIKSSHAEQLNQEQGRIESEYLSTFEVLKKVHEDEIEDMKSSFKKEMDDREKCLQSEHSKSISQLEILHSSDVSAYQKRIQLLLEEKCELLEKNTQEFEAILKKNHRALTTLCNHLRRRLCIQKEKLANESHKSLNSEFETSFSDALDELNKSIEHGLMKFLNQNYFSSDRGEVFDETEYLSFEISYPCPESINNKKSGTENTESTKKTVVDTKKEIYEEGNNIALSKTASDTSLESDDMHMIRDEINQLWEEFQKDATMYKNINATLQQECQSLRKQTEELEEHKKRLELQLHEKEKELAVKEAQIITFDTGSVKGTQLSTTDIRSWQVDAAQTNSRLLHVLSDLVKTFLDIEHDINSHLLEHGLVPSRSQNLSHHEEETGHSVGSREDFTSMSVGECTNLELAEDGFDLTPRSGDVFALAANYDTDVEGEDVVLGASRRLRMAVDQLLNLLTRALDSQQNQDVKLLLKRNEELSQELHEESQGRDAVHIELVTAESNIRKLECDKQRLEDLNRELKENQELMKREIASEKNKVARLSHEKEMAMDDIQTMKGQCEMLASRLGDPERKLLQENSRLSTEKQSAQKSLKNERQNFLDRLHHMELQLDELNAEKDELMEEKCKEIRDLRAEMEAMEKQLHSNKKFIDEQAQEREQEREEYMKEMNKMQDVVRDKEKIQSTELQLTKEIESLEQLLRARIEDHQNAMKKKDLVENDLRQSVDRIRDLRDIIEVLEKQLDLKTRVEAELLQKLAGLNESILSQERVNSPMSVGSPRSKDTLHNGDSLEQVENLKEQLASRSQEIEKMSQNQTLLHELRGQIHFLEAKVEQRARQLETMHSACITSPIMSDDNSPGGSQTSETLQLPCDEMSPRSIHWLEIRRLEEKIGRLVHIDEELIRKNRDLEAQLRRIRNEQTEYQHENAALQEKLSEQLMQISALKSHMDEQKHMQPSPEKVRAMHGSIEELQKGFELQLVNTKRAISEEAQAALLLLKDQMTKKDEIIAQLQKTVAASKKHPHFQKNASPEHEKDSPMCYKLMVLEKNDEITAKMQEIAELKKELLKLQRAKENSSQPEENGIANQKLANEFEKENIKLKAQIEILKSKVESLNESLRAVNDHLEREQAQVEALCEEVAHITQDNMGSSLVCNPDNYDSFLKSLEEVKTSLSDKLSTSNTALKEKNDEVVKLSASVSRLESALQATRKDLEIEQAQVDTLLEELGSLTAYQKRLEQDYNYVHEMMIEKERELATLHEETDAQLKLEAEFETLERSLEEQKSIERDLRKKMQQLEKGLEVSRKALENENNQWRTRVESLEQAHETEVGKLRKQVDILCRNFSGVEAEDIDLSEVKKEIVEASSAFDSTDGKAFGDLVYALLKKAVDNKLDQLSTRQEELVSEINQSWENKIKTELGSKNFGMKTHCEKLEKENLLLKEKCEEQSQRLSCEKGAIEQMLLKEQQALTLKYEADITNLKNNLERAMKEKSSLESKSKDLNHKVKELRQRFNNQRTELSRDFDSKIASIERDLREKYDSKCSIESVLRKEIEQLHADRQAKCEKEKVVDDIHREEVENLHKFYETRWVSEMKKLHEAQMDELRKLISNKEKNVQALGNHLSSQYEEKLAKMQDDYVNRLEQMRKLSAQQHLKDVENLRKSLEQKFEEEKLRILDAKEKQIKLQEKKYNKTISELRQSLSNGLPNWEEEKLEMLAVHQKEIVDLKQELENKFRKELTSHVRSHQAQMKSLEEMYNRQVEEAHELLKEAKHAASPRRHRSDSGSHRTTNTSSEMSSDDACSSCQEDMLPGNRHILVNKIHQDGKRVLSLIEASLAPSSSEKEVRLWLEERIFIINKVKVLTPEIVTNQANLKLVICNLVEELLDARQKLIKYNNEVVDYKERYIQIEQQLNTERSKFYLLASNLSHQTNVIKELESLLDSRTTEMFELKKLLAKDNKLSHQISVGSDSQVYSRNFISSSSQEIELPRSADEPRSLDQFSLMLPEIESSSIHKTVQELEEGHEDFKASPRLSSNIQPYFSRSDSPESVGGYARSDISNFRDELVSIPDNRIIPTSYEAKLHGLYWVYQRSKSYNKSLVYQKKYLLMLLKGYQFTENGAITWLNRMNDCLSPRSEGGGSSAAGSALRGRALFRAAAYACVAVQRMKFCVRRWRTLARVPSSQVVDAEVRTVFRNVVNNSPCFTPDMCHLSSISLPSKAPSISGVEHLTETQSVGDSWFERKVTGKRTSPEHKQLIEYVHRLDSLQKQLGLDTVR